MTPAIEHQAAQRAAIEALIEAAIAHGDCRDDCMSHDPDEPPCGREEALHEARLALYALLGIPLINSNTPEQEAHQ